MMSPSSAHAVGISITDSSLASGHKDGTLRLWNIRDRKKIKEI